MAPEQPYAFNGHAAAPPGSLPPPPPPPPPPLPPMLQPSHHSQQAPLHNELENEVTAMRASITPPSKRRRIQTYYDDLEKDAEILKTLLTDPF